MSKELNGEWVLGSNIPMANGVDIEVYTKHGDVRKVSRRPHVDFSSLWYTDCTHQLQNAFCSSSDIQAWRFIPQTLK